jgi:hypothetical protein
MYTIQYNRSKPEASTETNVTVKQQIGSIAIQKLEVSDPTKQFE